MESIVSKSSLGAARGAWQARAVEADAQLQANWSDRRLHFAQ